MIVTHKITIDLARRGVKPVIDAVQNDTGTRNVELSLFANGVPWEIPADTSFLVKYERQDGTGGSYDTLPDGNKAYFTLGNMVTFVLVSPALSKPGQIDVQLQMDVGDGVLSTFSFLINAEKEVTASGTTTDEDYTNIQAIIKKEVEDALDDAKTVRYTPQTLTTEQQAQARKNIGVTSSGGGVTSWNDLTDKPFYTGDPVETEVFNLSTALFREDDPIWEQQEQIDDTTYLWRSYPSALGKVFEVGKEYTVVIDGVEHKTTAIDGTTVDGEPGPEVALGDTEFFGTDSVPETFKYAILEIDDFGDTYFNIFYKGESAPKEFRVLGIKPEIVKIDPKYLPDGGVGYTTEGEYGIMRDERTFEVTNPDWGCLISRNLVLTDGETYHVTFNGVEYDCVAYRDPDDATIVHLGGDREPFKIQSQFGWCHLYPTEAGNHTVKIEGKQGLVYHKIDPRFLPDGFASIDDVYNIVDEALGVIENGTY